MTASKNALVSARVLNIFQLPAMIGCLIFLAPGPPAGPLSVQLFDQASAGPPMPSFVRTSTPGNFWPDRNSREAPPPVEMCVIFDSTPDWATAAAESPPPTMENAFESATARAIAKVP